MLDVTKSGTSVPFITTPHLQLLNGGHLHHGPLVAVGGAVAALLKEQSLDVCSGKGVRHMWVRWAFWGFITATAEIPGGSTLKAKTSSCHLGFLGTTVSMPRTYDNGSVPTAIRDCIKLAQA